MPSGVTATEYADWPSFGAATTAPVAALMTVSVPVVPATRTCLPSGVTAMAWLAMKGALPRGTVPARVMVAASTSYRAAPALEAK